MKKMKKGIFYTILFAVMANCGVAQTSGADSTYQRSKKAWVFGIGGSVFQFSRTSFSNFIPLETGYVFNLKFDHALFGGNLYIARELNDHFSLDLQGTIGATENKPKNKTEWLYMGGLGLQWRLGNYFDSKYIDPYFRAGINYMHKEFEILYVGTEGLEDEQMKWVLNNLNNKSGADRKDLMPVALGGGINMWLNDRWGIGMQGDYLLMPYNNVANSLQGTLRIMLRFGGKSKKTQSVVQYVDRIVEVEKILEIPAKIEARDPVSIIKEIEKLLTLEGINFDFDKANLTPESNQVLDKLAEVLKQDTNKRYLITGYTDSQGSDEYNLNLSRQRAEVVVRAFTERGVPSFMLKARGVGKKIAYAEPSMSDNVRRGDRKMTIEPISNKDYWDYLPEHGF